MTRDPGKIGTAGSFGDETDHDFIAECAQDFEWFHCRPMEFHKARPDLSRQYVQRQTGNTEAPCLACGESVVRHPLQPLRHMEIPHPHPHPQPEPEPPPKTDPTTFGRSLPEWARRRRMLDA